MPNGFSSITTEDQGTKETGFVIKNDTDGNEFVWVPVEDMEYTYDRYAFSKEDWNGKQSKEKYDSVTNSYKIMVNSNSYSYYFTEKIQKIREGITELDSVKKYGGFYIGRYEVGITDYTNVNTDNINNDIKWTAYIDGTAVIQKGKDVWNRITRNKAIEIAENFYLDNDAIISKLCSSYAWDTTLKFIETKNSAYTTNSTVGNYSGALKKTGQTIAVNNIYDIGGNVWEWTTEGNNNPDLEYTNRGGRFL